ncbi:bifunctional AP2-ERF domain/AP2-coincident [Babesia duncani]|uniref:Bifunctional AP2-ERF domain/AP2-coincident n=1 Tax=Babesia duncani TaxID=323732 RepID=A0AAD9UPJ3_9APIC|nr:bifunctional AP2-ERF domain/AP2-coincident [Babesia duncani]
MPRRSTGSPVKRNRSNGVPQKWADDQKRQLFKQSTLLPKVVGVSYDRFQAIWVAHWRINGKTYHKYFNTFKLGFEQAYHKAIKCRLRNISQCNNLTNKSNSLDALLPPANEESLLDNAETSLPDPISNIDKDIQHFHMCKVALYYILFDLKDIALYLMPMVTYTSLGDLYVVIENHISNVWTAGSVGEIQHYLDLFKTLMGHHVLPSHLPLEEQAAYLFTIFKMPVMRMIPINNNAFGASASQNQISTF